MQTDAALSAPILETRGRVGPIDVSAWISGLSYAAGFVLTGRSGLETALQSGMPVLVAAFAIFLVTVLFIQRYMQLSLLAKTFGSPQQLVTSGIFQYSRNPIYAAFFVPLVSLGIVSLVAAAVSCAIYIFSMNSIVIRKEERELRAAFGIAFDEYLAKTPRWIF